GVHKLRAKYRSKIEASDRRIMTAQQAVGREQQQLSSRTVDMAGSIIGSLIGRRGIGAAITSAARKGTTASKDLGDVQRAKERLAAATQERAELEEELARELSALQDSAVDAETIELETVVVRPTSRDIVVRFLGIVWLPFVENGGRWEPG